MKNKDFRSQFVVVENDDARRYEFNSQVMNQCSYTVDYSECLGSLGRAWEAVEKNQGILNVLSTKTVSDGHVYEPPACALCGASKAEHDAERRRRDEQMEFERMDWETTQEEGL